MVDRVGHGGIHADDAYLANSLDPTRVASHAYVNPLVSQDRQALSRSIENRSETLKRVALSSEYLKTRVQVGVDMGPTDQDWQR